MTANTNTGTNAIIVGSGVSGALVAKRLIQRGIEPIVILEAGADLPMRDHRTWLDMITTNRAPYEGRRDINSEYTSTGIDPWKIEGGRLIVRGGSTIHWGGWSPRFQPEDFELRSRTGIGLDWPFGYAELEPWYCEAERSLHVAGNSHSQTHPWRSKPYPFEAAPFTEPDGVVISALQALDLSYDHMPIARNTLSIDGRPACHTFNTCRYCPIGARYSADQTLDELPAQKVELRLRSPVRRVLMNGKSRAIGVEYVDMSSSDKRVQILEAERVIICAGAIETPKLLLASADTAWPAGIGNDTGHVGRHLIANPYFFARGVHDANPHRWQQELTFATLCSRQWDVPQTQKQGKFLLNKADSAPAIDISKLMSAGLSTKQIDAEILGPVTFELQGTMQTFGHFDNRVEIGKEMTRFGLATTLINTPVKAYDQGVASGYLDKMKQILTRMEFKVQAADIYPQRGDHAMCTTRLSSSSTDGVVEPELFRVHGVDNLHIISNAIFASGSPANPTLTLAALALRFADRVQA